MKKSIWLVLILFILGTGILCAAAFIADAEKEVVLTEKTLYGDKSAVKGLQVEMNTNLENTLHWNIRHQFESGQTESRFKFGKRYAKESANWWMWDSGKGIRLGLGVPSMGSLKTSYAGGAAGNFLKYYEEFGLGDVMEEIVEQAVKNAPAGTTYEEFFYLKDYMDVYPLTVDVYVLSGVGDVNGAMTPERVFSECFREYFQMPMQDGYGVTISIEKDEKGEIEMISLSDGESADRPEIERFSVLTDKGCYFTFQERNGRTRLFDTSRLLEYGLYYIPYRVDGESKWMYFEDMRVVYPMDQQIRLEQIALSEDESQVYLLLTDRGMLKFAVIDVKTAQTEQIIDLVPVSESYYPEPLNSSYEYDNFIAVNVVGEDPQTLILEKGDDGRFEHVLTAHVQELLVLGSNYNWSTFGNNNITKWTDEISNTTMAWNGEQLAVASFQWANQYTCNFHLAVYGKTGLLYCGEYQNSLNSDHEVNAYHSYWSCRPDERDIWTLSWQ